MRNERGRQSPRHFFLSLHIMSSVAWAARVSACRSPRHAGVLGLCACVEAFPYDVPLFIPDVLVTLSRHLNDPQPIQVRGVAGWHSRVVQVRTMAFTGRTGTHGDIYRYAGRYAQAIRVRSPATNNRHINLSTQFFIILLSPCFGLCKY